MEHESQWYSDFPTNSVKTRKEEYFCMRVFVVVVIVTVVGVQVNIPL